MKEEGREREDAGMELPVPSHRARRGSGCHSGAGSPRSHSLPAPPAQPLRADTSGRVSVRAGREGAAPRSVPQPLPQPWAGAAPARGLKQRRRRRPRPESGTGR